MYYTNQSRGEPPTMAMAGTVATSEYSLKKRSLTAPSLVCVLKYVTSTWRTGTGYFQLNGRLCRSKYDIEIWCEKFLLE